MQNKVRESRKKKNKKEIKHALTGNSLHFYQD